MQAFSILLVKLDTGTSVDIKQYMNLIVSINKYLLLKYYFIHNFPNLIKSKVYRIEYTGLA